MHNVHEALKFPLHSCYFPLILQYQGVKILKMKYGDASLVVETMLEFFECFSDSAMCSGPTVVGVTF